MKFASDFSAKEGKKYEVFENVCGGFNIACLAYA